MQGGSVKSWKRRYFELSEGHLAYYKNPGDSNPLGKVRSCTVVRAMSENELLSGMIQLANTAVRQFPDSERQHCFGVITPARTYLFQADSYPEVHSWLAELNKVQAMHRVEIDG